MVVVGVVGPAPPPNQSPIARNDTAETEWDTPVVIYVLDNDTDPNGDKLALASVTQPQNGSVKIIGDAVIYTPSPSVPVYGTGAHITSLITA